MTTLAPPAELCGHRWGQVGWGGHRWSGHRCDEPAHPPTVPHRCRCGATTTERTPDDHRL